MPIGSLTIQEMQKLAITQKGERNPKCPLKMFQWILTPDDPFPDASDEPNDETRVLKITMVLTNLQVLKPNETLFYHDAPTSIYSMRRRTALQLPSLAFHLAGTRTSGGTRC